MHASQTKLAVVEGLSVGLLWPAAYPWNLGIGKGPYESLIQGTLCRIMTLIPHHYLDLLRYETRGYSSRQR